MIIRKARDSEAEELKKLIEFYAKRNEMLPRSLSEIYENLRDYWVWEERKCIRGCVALHVCWIGLGEIKSLAVAKRFRGRGIGTALVTKCMEEAKELGLKKIFVLTFRPEFFKKRGFKPIAKEDLPNKIWSECIRCVRFPNCDENAMIYNL